MKKLVVVVFAVLLVAGPAHSANDGFTTHDCRDLAHTAAHCDSAASADGTSGAVSLSGYVASRLQTRAPASAFATATSTITAPFGLVVPAEAVKVTANLHIESAHASATTRPGGLTSGGASIDSRVTMSLTEAEGGGRMHDFYGRLVEDRGDQTTITEANLTISGTLYFCGSSFAAGPRIIGIEFDLLSYLGALIPGAGTAEAALDGTVTSLTAEPTTRPAEANCA